MTRDVDCRELSNSVTASDTIDLFVNGASVRARCRPDTTVLQWLRRRPDLRGTKEGCAEGDCGACSVLIGRVVDGEIRHEPANSCIVTMGQVAHASVVTIEGIGRAGALHPVQEHMAARGGSQCGFCTPGFIVALTSLHDRTMTVDDDAIHDALAGNLCRCTGYRPIVESAHRAIEDRVEPIAKRLGLRADQLGGPLAESVTVEGATYHQPASIAGLVELRARYPEATLLAGGTDLNLALASFRQQRPRTIAIGRVRELRVVEDNESELVFGGAVTWQQSLPALQRYFPSFATLVRRFGSPQIRSIATLAGNLATASPIGDGAPPLLALGAWLTASSHRGDRRILLDDFFVDYRTTALAPDEIIRTIHIPKPAPADAFRVYKVSKRYDQDISTVCGAFVVRRENGIVRHARIAFGGLAKTPLRCPDAERALVDQPLTVAAAKAAGRIVRDHYRPLSDQRASAAYRSLVAQNLCERLVHDLANQPVDVMDYERT